jgi:predicted Zn-dependent protease
VSRLQETIEKVLSLSKADECIVIAQESSTANIRWANNTTTTNGVAEDMDLFIISVIGKRVGSVGRNYFPDESLEALVRESEASCEGKPEAEDYMTLMEGDGSPPEDWTQDPARTAIDVFDQFAPDLAQLFKNADSSDVKLFGFAEHSGYTLYLATSSGIRRRHPQFKGQVEINAKSSDFKQSVWAGQVSKTFTDVDLGSIYGSLEQRLAWSEKSASLEPGDYQVLLEPSAVADMLTYAYWTSAARDADEGRTVFSKKGGGNRIGEKLYADGVTIYSDPQEPGLEVEDFTVAVASSSHSSVFDNGLQAKRTEWARDGVLNALITTRHWAEKSGAEPVPFLQNLVFPSEGPSLDEMIASTERALLVTCFWYIRAVDPQTLLLTGLTRDGVFLVEGGKVKSAVNNFRYNMSPVDMLAQTVEIGATEPTLPREFGDYFTFTKMPPIRVDDFNMSSVSQAT